MRDVNDRTDESTLRYVTHGEAAILSVNDLAIVALEFREPYLFSMPPTMRKREAQPIP